MPTYQSASLGSLPLRAAVFHYSRGVLPSSFVAYMPPQDGLDLSGATLRIGDVSWSNVAIASAHVRRHSDNKHPIWAVHGYDRRYRWAGKTVSGDYNRRQADGTVDPATQKTPQELANICLNALGEGGYDSSQMPSGVWPRFKFTNTEARLALAWLCERVACDVVLNPLTDLVEIWRLGNGRTSSTGVFEKYAKARFAPRAYVPSTISAFSGDVLFQSKLQLKNVVRSTVGTPNQQWLLANTTPAAGVAWSVESPWSLPDITTTDRPNAFEEVYREFRVMGQSDGSLAIPGFNFPVSSVDQYLLQSNLLTSETDIAGFKRPIPAYIEGQFWAYTDLPNNTASGTRYTGSFQIDPERRIVKLPFPLFGASSSGAYQEPTLNLVTSYKARTTDGLVAGLYFNGSVGGSGGTLVLRRPEIFAVYDFINSTNTQSQALTELQQYVSLFQQKFASPWASEITYPYLASGTLDGNVSQATWRWYANRPEETDTTVYENYDGDPLSVGESERRRRLQLASLVEAAG